MIIKDKRKYPQQDSLKEPGNVLEDEITHKLYLIGCAHDGDRKTTTYTDLTDGTPYYYFPGGNNTPRLINAMIVLLDPCPPNDDIEKNAPT
jgi:hypothetical protein